MSAPRTARARARQELTREIKTLALRQLAEAGAADLSLRAVARELGMVSSALYRYFPSRDHLLTALIVEAYDDLADAVEAADKAMSHERFRTRWVARCHAFRAWARAEPHRFALIYGSPVPGYRAPDDTIAPAGRVVAALSRVVDQAAVDGALAADADPKGPELMGGDPVLVEQLRTVAAILTEAVPPAVFARLATAFGQLVGLTSLELGGHFVGGFEPADAFFEHAVQRLADDLGLRDC